MNNAIKYGFIVLAILALALIPGTFLSGESATVCIFRSFTGIECPLCGMTRACFNIVHLDFPSAFGYNPVSLMLPVILITEIGYDVFPTRRLARYRKAVFIFSLSALAILFIIRLIHHFNS